MKKVPFAMLALALVAQVVSFTKGGHNAGGH